MLVPFVCLSAGLGQGRSHYILGLICIKRQDYLMLFNIAKSGIYVHVYTSLEKQPHIYTLALCWRINLSDLLYASEGEKEKAEP